MDELGSYEGGIVCLWGADALYSSLAAYCSIAFQDLQL